MAFFVTQLNHEAGADMAWDDWLVLEHEETETSKIAELLQPIDLSWPGNGDTYGVGTPEWDAWFARVLSDLTEAGFRHVNSALYVFNSLQ